MAFQPVPDVAEAVFEFSGVATGNLVGCEAQFSLYVRDTVTGWDATQLTQLANYFQDWFDNGKGTDPALDTVIDDGWRLDRIVCRDLSTAGGIVVSLPVNLTGQRAGEGAPPNTCVQVKYVLDPPGPPTRGWIFLPAGGEADLNGTNWASALLTEIQDCFDGMDENLSVSGEGGEATWAQVRISRTAGTEAELATIRDLREQLREAIAATRRSSAESNTLAAPVVPVQRIASQRNRRSD